MRVRMLQHAVGQGGLFSGELSAGGKPLRWVYDCGSNQPVALGREINDVAAGGHIDLLYLSHLDSDHANGVDRLLSSRINVREVVLPYLSASILLATIARDSASGTLTGSFIALASDPAHWFGSRGVETVTFVGGRGDDEDEGGPAVPGAPEGDEGGEVQAKWTREPDPVPEGALRPGGIQGGERAQLQTVPHGTACMLSTQHSLLNWVLIPYVHQPSGMLLAAFDQSLEHEFGAPLDKAAIIRGATDAAVRRKLRSCYDALWVDHNLVSMTLYAGPMKEMQARIWLGSPRDLERLGSDFGGWMLTGDAHLDRDIRRDRFLKFYWRYLRLINVLMLPHHGSYHNHSDKVLEVMPHLIVGYAASGPNNHGHPSKAVKHAMNYHRRGSFHRVSEKRSSRLCMEVQI